MPKFSVNQQVISPDGLGFVSATSYAIVLVRLANGGQCWYFARDVREARVG